MVFWISLGLYFGELDGIVLEFIKTGDKVQETNLVVVVTL